MDRRNISAIFASVVILSVFLFGSAAASDTEPRSIVPVNNSQSLGPANAPVTFIEFIDYQ